MGKQILPPHHVKLGFLQNLFFFFHPQHDYIFIKKHYLYIFFSPRFIDSKARAVKTFHILKEKIEFIVPVDVVHKCV